MAAALCALPATAHADALTDTSDRVAGALNFPWPDLLPALPTSANPQPGAVPGCAEPTPRCIDLEVAGLRDLRGRLRCDHRAVFATTYLVLTLALRDKVRSDPRFFADPRYLYTEDALFAHYYFRTVDDYAAGRPVPRAWRIAFDTAARGGANAAQDMLLGINAHVQRDMPFVLAQLGLRRPDGSSRKGDHDRVNDVLQRAYEPVVQAIARSYDPFVSISNAGASPVDNIAGLEMVKGWREGVWRNAERLLNAATPAQRQAVANSIEANAAGWARTIAAGRVPGYRARRDAYCARRVGG
ncbi:MAG TPA: DUF5995 family protein [Solirubrobacteraceae bacterium]|nr:DUF5995 family protein [Solirubrobacteraceae bacterium]